MKRKSRLTKKLNGFWKSRIKKVKPNWIVRYEVFERKGETFKSTGEFAEVMVMAGDRKEAFMRARKKLAPIYNVYHYGFKFKSAKKT